MRMHPRVIVAVAALVAASCGEGEPSAPPTDAMRLDGEWEVEFRVEQPATLSAEAVKGQPVHARLILVPNDRPLHVPHIAGMPSNYGLYSADLRPLGVESAPYVPTVVARLTPGDSVQIAFDPDLGAPLAGKGVLAGDSVQGRWRTSGSRVAGSSVGSFVMRRAAKHRE